VAAVVLLRSVGYVLASVDAKISPEYKEAIAAAWDQLNQSKPRPAIFWEFVDRERHNIVHEYEIGAGQGATVHLARNFPVERHYLVNTSPFAGYDQREILREAIAWWEACLNDIDQAAR
jgi:hypothetical protein